MFGSKDELLRPFALSVRPSATEIGLRCQQGTPQAAAFFFSFGKAVASQQVDDVWTACCEIYLQAQLVRRARLRDFQLNGEQLFRMTFVNDVILCSWSPEHVFAVKGREFVGSSETLVEQVLAAAPHRTDEFLQLGASLMTQSRFAALNEFELQPEMSLE